MAAGSLSGRSELHRNRGGRHPASVATRASDARRPGRSVLTARRRTRPPDGTLGGGRRRDAGRRRLRLCAVLNDAARDVWWFRECDDLDVVVWLARNDSNLRSPDPESGDRFSRFFACREHETHRFLPPILPSLVTYRQTWSGGHAGHLTRHSDHRSHARQVSGAR